MDLQIPDTVTSLLSFLEKDCGLSMESQRTDYAAFGNTLMVLRGQHFRVRLLRERLDWYVEVSSDQRPNKWHDMALLKGQIKGGLGLDVLSFDEQVAFFRANWQGILEILVGPDSTEMQANLDRIRQERVKRMFPGWVK